MIRFLATIIVFFSIVSESFAAYAISNERAVYVSSRLIANGFSNREITTLFEDSRLKLYPPIKPAGINWGKFIEALLHKWSVGRGKRFLDNHSRLFRDAEGEFSVEREYIASIVRVETDFGDNLGNYVTLNVFYTALVTKSAPKWRAAADNLVALVIYCRKLKVDCFSIKGSYAGAFGIPQFLPTSAIAYGYDGDGDGRVDLFNVNDAIPSTANFLVKHGWHKNRSNALARYYGSSNGYPRAVILYASAIKGSISGPP